MGNPVSPRTASWLRTLAAWGLLCTLPHSLCWADNGHEHLQYLPGYEDFVHAGINPAEIPASLVLSGDELKLRQIFGKEIIEKLLTAPDHPGGIRKSFPSTDRELAAALRQHIQGKTLGLLSQELAHGHPGVTSTEVLRSFFEITPFNGTTDLQKKNAYTGIGYLRSRILSDRKDTIRNVIRAYLNRVDPMEWRKSEISVPSSLYEKEVLAGLGDEFQKHGGKARFFLSVTREKANLQREKDQLEKIHRSIQEGWGHGVDVVGSGREVNEPAVVEKVAEISARLETMTKALGTTGTMRVHAFEAAREGAFYSGFWEFLESHAARGTLPAEIRIGHINALTDSDIERFRRIRKLTGKKTEFIFDANIESNLVLQGTKEKGEELARLSNTIEKLHASGFRVALGSDGQGILGESSQFKQTIHALTEAGLKPSSVHALIVNPSFAHCVAAGL